VLVIGPPRLSARQEEDEAALPCHSTPVRWGRMVTGPYSRCWPLLPLKPEELRWHSRALYLRGTMPSLVALGPGLSIGITIVVTPFIDILAAQLLLFLLEEFSYVSGSLRREPPSCGFGVVPLTLARSERLFCFSVPWGHSPDLFLHSREVSCGCASARRFLTLLLFPHDRAVITFWVSHCVLPRPFAPLISLGEIMDPDSL
jgi:hypothetical protein